MKITNYILTAGPVQTQSPPEVIADGTADGSWVMIRCETKKGCFLRTEIGGTPWLMDKETLVLRLQLGEQVFASPGSEKPGEDALVEVWVSTLSLMSNVKV